MKQSWKHSFKNTEKLITGIIIGSAIISIFGFSKTKKGKEIKKKMEGKTIVFTRKIWEKGKFFSKQSFSYIKRSIQKIPSLFKKK